MEAWQAFAVGLPSAGALSLAWASLIERRLFTLRHAQLKVLRRSGTLKVLHLSDLHLLPWQRDKMRFVESLAAYKPDLVVATGDLLGHADAIEPCVAALRTVAGNRPAAFVLGSNDFFAPGLRNPFGYFRSPSGVRSGQQRLETDLLVAGLTDAGWLLLDNQRATLPSPIGPLDLAGLGDPHIRRDRPEQVSWHEPAADAALYLGVVHAPYRRALDVFATQGTDVVLAGHTHGGQVRIPGIGALVTNCDLPRKQARGVSNYHLNDDQQLALHVSAGLGTSMYAPLRFCCRPEATLLTLTQP